MSTYLEVIDGAGRVTHHRISPIIIEELAIAIRLDRAAHVDDDDVVHLLVFESVWDEVCWRDNRRPRNNIPRRSECGGIKPTYRQTSMYYRAVCVDCSIHWRARAVAMLLGDVHK